MYGNLRKFRESLGITQKQFAASLSIGLTTYNGYETGARDPKSDFWIAVAQKYHVSIDYLMGFSDDPQPQFSQCESGEPEEKRLIKNYRSLNEEGQEKLLEYSDDLVELGKYKKRDKAKLDSKEA